MASAPSKQPAKSHEATMQENRLFMQRRCTNLLCGKKLTEADMASPMPSNGKGLNYCAECRLNVDMGPSWDIVAE